MRNVQSLKMLFGLLVFILAGCVHSTALSREPNQDQAVAASGTRQVDPAAYSKVYAISDVHGMYDNALKVLKAGGVIDDGKNWIAGNSLLVITGDSIDKGAKSIEVIDLWIQLEQQAAKSGGLVIHTLGNHEAEFLANPNTTNPKAAELIAEMQSLRIPLSDLTTTSTIRGRFIHSEPVALRVGAWLFCHSGYYPDLSWEDFSAKSAQVLAADSYGDDFLIGSDSILEKKKWELDSSTAEEVLGRLDNINVFGVVFGHQPSAFGIQGRSAAKMGGRLIKIDNGMAPEAGSNPGSLLVFTNPAQMNQQVFPAIKIIAADGAEKNLMPE